MRKVKFIAVLLLVSSGIAHSQADTLVKKLDSLRAKKDSAGVQNNNIDKEAYTKNTQFTFSSYFILLGSDLKQEVTKPFHFKKRDWLRVGEVGLTMAALSFADEPVQRFGLKLRDSSSAVRNVGHFITNFGGNYETVTLIGLGTYGFAFKNKKIQTTTLLATHA